MTRVNYDQKFAYALQYLKDGGHASLSSGLPINHIVRNAITHDQN